MQTESPSEAKIVCVPSTMIYILSALLYKIHVILTESLYAVYTIISSIFSGGKPCLRLHIFTGRAGTWIQPARFEYQSTVPYRKIWPIYTIY